MFLSRLNEKSEVSVIVGYRYGTAHPAIYAQQIHFLGFLKRKLLDFMETNGQAPTRQYCKKYFYCIN